MSVKVLQNDSSIEHQRKLIAEALPELESIFIIGRRKTGHPDKKNFCSCSFSEVDLSFSIGNFLINAPTSIVKSFINGVISYLKFIKA